MFAWLLMAALPVGYIALQAIAASRNIVFWDEFDTALDLILRLDMGAGWNELLQRFFAVSNEHRMMTSRLMFAISYWLTGTVNFHVFGAIGNLFLVAACGTLVAAVHGAERRVRLGVILAYLMFQLEHFENFLWSGASIDHFQVVALAVGAIVLVARASRAALFGAMLLGVLATFTLAHGSLVWPIGALLLARQQRWKPLLAWLGLAVITAALFLQGFAFNPSHLITPPAGRSLVPVVSYWLALLGAPLTLGDTGFAFWPGLALLAGFGVLLARGALTREPAVMGSAFFAVGALALVAYGRSELAGSEINSRYLVLGALAWALLIFLLLELATTPARPYRLLACLLPALVAFNLAANVRYAPLAEGYIELRERAATAYKQYGEDGHGLMRLHPQEGHADALLRRAEERDLYTLPRFSQDAEFPDAVPNAGIITYVDQLLVNERAVTVGGWAMIPDEESIRGSIYVVLQSARTRRILSTITLQRPDVAKAYDEPRWRLSGFRAVVLRSRLPDEDFDVGVLIDGADGPEYLMTPNRLLLSAGRKATAFRPAPPP